MGVRDRETERERERRGGRERNASKTYLARRGDKAAKKSLHPVAAATATAAAADRVYVSRGKSFAENMNDFGRLCDDDGTSFDHKSGAPHASTDHAHGNPTNPAQDLPVLQ